MYIIGVATTMSNSVMLLFASWMIGIRETFRAMSKLLGGITAQN
jgi:hypothetical protein